MNKGQSARRHLLRSQELLIKGDYKGSLKENQKVLFMVVKKPPGDKALFNMGLICAHYGNPEKDYKKSMVFFTKLIKEYPKSTLVEQAKIWVGILDVIEKEKQVDIEIEKKKKELEKQGQSTSNPLLRSQELLIRGDYKGSLKENQKVLSMVAKKPPGDKALFNMGLIYAHYGNPEKDYKKSMVFFTKLIKEYPKSTLVERAKIWVNILDVIEKEKQVDIEIEKKKKEFEGSVVQREEVDSSIEPAKKVSKQLITSVDAHIVNQNEKVISRKGDAHIAVLEEEGGSLYFLAMKHYKKANETLFDLILQANPSITDVRQIDDPKKIIIPVITSESYIKKLSGGEYRVHIGTFDTYEMATVYSKRASNLEKLLFIDSRQFSSQDTWYRLTMGNLKNKEEALETVSLLQEKGLIYIPPKHR